MFGDHHMSILKARLLISPSNNLGMTYWHVVAFDVVKEGAQVLVTNMVSTSVSNIDQMILKPS